MKCASPEREKGPISEVPIEEENGGEFWFVERKGNVHYIDTSPWQHSY